MNYEGELDGPQPVHDKLAWLTDINLKIKLKIKYHLLLFNMPCPTEKFVFYAYFLKLKEKISKRV